MEYNYTIKYNELTRQGLTYYELYKKYRILERLKGELKSKGKLLPFSNKEKLFIFRIKYVPKGLDMLFNLNY